MRFRGDSNVLASASEDGTVKLWNPLNGDLLETHHEPTGAVTCLAFARDGQTLAAGFDKVVYLWQRVR